uniref:Uncharacterized protein n=1 Tax=Ciona intestinalis TaxID=7719 RepID=H2Y0Z2_CIOIN
NTIRIFRYFALKVSRLPPSHYRTTLRHKYVLKTRVLTLLKPKFWSTVK